MDRVRMEHQHRLMLTRKVVKEREQQKRTLNGFVKGQVCQSFIPTIVFYD